VAVNIFMSTEEQGGMTFADNSGLDSRLATFDLMTSLNRLPAAFPA
jgi:hypothetical protein